MENFIYKKRPSNTHSDYFAFWNKKNNEIKVWSRNISNLNFQKATPYELFYDIDEFHIEAIIPQHLLYTTNTGETTAVISQDKLPKGVEIRTFNNNKKRSIFIPFQFVDSITVKERTPAYATQNIMSRFEPVRIWQGGNYLGIDLKLTYLAIDFEYNEEWVEKMTALLRALAMPTYTGTATFYPPPLLYLKFGDLFDNIPCVLTGISREFPMGMFAYNDPDGIQFENDNIRINALPKYQTVTLNLESQYPREYENAVDLKKIILREEGIKRGKSSIDQPVEEGKDLRSFI